jgi:hypothetical protein
LASSAWTAAAAEDAAAADEATSVVADGTCSVSVVVFLWRRRGREAGTPPYRCAALYAMKLRVSSLCTLRT